MRIIAVDDEKIALEALSGAIKSIVTEDLIKGDHDLRIFNTQALL